MKIAAIICEYNPLQNGHIYHISRAKTDSGADKVICIMSGNFTQRGTLAIADKYTRATWAIKAGADMVIELPPEYVLTTAKYFALGGVKIADTLNADTTLSFGSEIGDLQALKDVASFEENDDFKLTLNEYLQQGNGYAKSYCLAMEKLFGQSSNLLSSPNNILAVEYLKALKSLHSSITPHTIERVGGGYHQTTPSDCPSASCARSMWKNGDFTQLKQGIPQYVFEYLNNTNPNDFDLANEKLFALLKYNIDTAPLQNIHGVKEGIENRIVSALKDSNNLSKLLSALATKRYTNAYLLRTLTNILISNTYQADYLENKKIDYANVLAVEKNSKDLLSAINCNVVTKTYELPSGSLIPIADKLYSSVRYNFPACMQIVER